MIQNAPTNYTDLSRSAWTQELICTVPRSSVSLLDIQGRDAYVCVGNGGREEWGSTSMLECLFYRPMMHSRRDVRQTTKYTLAGDGTKSVLCLGTTHCRH